MSHVGTTQPSPTSAATVNTSAIAAALQPTQPPTTTIPVANAPAVHIAPVAAPVSASSAQIPVSIPASAVPPTAPIPIVSTQIPLGNTSVSVAAAPSVAAPSSVTVPPVPVVETRSTLKQLENELRKVSGVWTTSPQTAAQVVVGTTVHPAPAPTHLVETVIAPNNTVPTPGNYCFSIAWANNTVYLGNAVYLAL